MKLSKLVNESWLEEGPSYTDDDKNTFLSEVAAYNSYGKHIYQEQNYVDIAKKLFEMAKIAEHVAMNEQANSFDKITVKRNMNELKKFAQEFAKVATEGQGIRDRLASLYEDMGHIYHRYFEVKDMDGDGTPDTVVAKNDTPEVSPMMYQEDIPGKAAKRSGKLATPPVSPVPVRETGSRLPLVRKGLDEAGSVSYDAGKFIKMVRGDKFLAHVVRTMGKTRNMEAIFNTYVLGDSEMERLYRKA